MRPLVCYISWLKNRKFHLQKTFWYYDHLTRPWSPSHPHLSPELRDASVQTLKCPVHWEKWPCNANFRLHPRYLRQLVIILGKWPHNSYCFRYLVGYFTLSRSYCFFRAVNFSYTLTSWRKFCTVILKQQTSVIELDCPGAYPDSWDTV